MEPENKVEYVEPQQLGAVSDTDVLTISGAIPTIASAPTHTPVKFADQFRIYNNRLYVYDTTNNTWKYTALT